MVTRDGLRATTMSVTVSSLAAAGSLGLAAVVIARTLGPDGRGVFAASYSLVYLLMIVGSLGIGPGGRRLLALGVDVGGVSATEYASAARRLVLTHIPVTAVAALVLLPVFGAGRSVAERIAFVACGVASLASLLAREALYGLDRGARSSLILSMGCLATLVGVIGVAALDRAGVAVYLWMYALAAVGEALFAARAVGRIGQGRPTPVRPMGRSLVLRSGGVILPLLLAHTVATRGDRLIVGAVAGSAELGEYAVAVSVMELLSMASLSLGNVAFQGLASGRVTLDAMAGIRRFTLAGTAVAAVGVILAAPWLIDVVFGSEYAGAVPTLRVLAIASIVYGSFQIDTHHLIATGSARLAAAMAIGAAALMVVGDLIVVPVRGIEGAAWVSVAVYAVGAAAARQAVGRRRV